MTLPPPNPNAATFVPRFDSHIRCEGHSDIEPYYGPLMISPIARWILKNRRSVISGSEERAIERGNAPLRLIREFGPQVC